MISLRTPCRAGARKDIDWSANDARRSSVERGRKRYTGQSTEHRVALSSCDRSDSSCANLCATQTTWPRPAECVPTVTDLDAPISMTLSSLVRPRSPLHAQSLPGATNHHPYTQQSCLSSLMSFVWVNRQARRLVAYVVVQWWRREPCHHHRTCCRSCQPACAKLCSFSFNCNVCQCGCECQCHGV